MSTQDLSRLVARLEAVCTRLEGQVGPNQNGLPDSPVTDSTPAVLAYSEIISGPFAQFLQLSSVIGSHVNALAIVVSQALDIQRQFISTASTSKEPSRDILSYLLKPTSEKIAGIQEFRQRNRESPLFNHLSAISESIPALGWITVPQTPAPYVKEMLDAGQFYTNRILMEYKNKDQTHVDWVKAWIQTLSDLQAFVRQYYITGLTWNPRGKEASITSNGGGQAPPPPPPPMIDLSKVPNPTSGAGDGRAALFAELNQGSDITKGLRKVTSDQQTHKNPALKEMEPVVSKTMSGPRPFKPVTSTATSVKPPKLELEGKKWIVENHQGNKEIVISETQMQQVAYIYNCVNSVIQVKGKINSITVDSCKKTSIVFDDLVSTIEIINSQSIQTQVMGKVPTILIAKVDGCQVYLSQSSLEAEIVTSKSSEMNILVPTPDGDFNEFPVPEQYKTVWSGRGLKTEVVEQA